MKQSEKGSYLHSKTEKIKQSSGGDTSHKPVRSLTKKPEIIEDSDDMIKADMSGSNNNVLECTPLPKKKADAGAHKLDDEDPEVRIRRV